MSAAGLGGAALPLSACLPAREGVGRPTPRSDPDLLRPDQVRSVIFLALDGTGYEDLAAATFFSERVLNRRLLYGELLDRSACGSMFPHSLTSVVTDSAAATTAWSTGRKVVNGSLSQLPDGRSLHTILELAQDRGMATGLVTSTRITHATPAGWAAKVPHRDMDDEIAEQYLELGVDVLLGGGVGPFQADERADGRDLLAEARAAGYDVLLSPDDLARSNGTRLLGAFSPGLEHLSYEIDRRYRGAPDPSLAQITTKALEVLDGFDGGFLLQVEAGRIDHANHQNDAGASLWDWIAADDALQVILEYVDRTPGTLLISAADHDTGGGVIYGVGSLYTDSTKPFETLGRARGSLLRLRRELGRNPSLAEAEELIHEFLGFRPSARQIQAALGAHRDGDRHGHISAHNSRLNSMNFVLSGMEGSDLDRPNVAFATGTHTGGLVPVLQYGTGVPPGSLGIVDNTRLFDWMTSAIGIEGFENPGMSEEEALELAAVPAGHSRRPHWI